VSTTVFRQLEGLFQGDGGLTGGPLEHLNPVIAPFMDDENRDSRHNGVDGGLQPQPVRAAPRLHLGVTDGAETGVEDP
jgi:hypothetical protein